MALACSSLDTQHFHLHKDCSTCESFFSGFHRQKRVHRFVFGLSLSIVTILALLFWIVHLNMDAGLAAASTFGDVLAQVSSRASNTGLLIVLSHLYKRDFRVFVLLLELDIVGHWFRIYCEVMSKRCPCLHLHLYQNSIYRNPFFRLFCALSQEIMYMVLYLISFDWMEHGHPVKLDFLRNKDSMHSKYFKSLVAVTPGYLIRQIATLDEIRLATDMCVHFDHQKYCCNEAASQPACEPSPAEPHLHLVVTATRRGRPRSRPRKRTRSRSKDRFDQAW